MVAGSLIKLVWQLISGGRTSSVATDPVNRSPEQCSDGQILKLPLCSSSMHSNENTTWKASRHIPNMGKLLACVSRMGHRVCARARARACVCVFGCVRVRACACVCVCMYVCVNVCV